MTKRSRKSRLWYFDPSDFQPLRKASFLEHYFLRHTRSIGRYTLYALAFAYPVTIVTMGIIFGGLVFWSIFAGSVGLMWLIIVKTGYSKNFANWDVSTRKFLGLFMAFGAALAFYYGLIYLKFWAFPVTAGALVVAFVLGLWKLSRS
jgi:hypothetical protein